MGGEFICDNCERDGPAFNDSHMRMHTVMRISISEEVEKSTQERLRLVEDELAKMRQNLMEVTKTIAEMKQTLGKLVERSGEWSQGGLLTKGDLKTVVNEAVKSAEGA